MRLLVNGLALVGAATLAHRFWPRGVTEPPCPPVRPVRDAGPDKQSGISEDDWDIVDEQSDESFPASDPPANY